MAGFENLLAGSRQMVVDPPSVAGAPCDQVLGGEPVGEGAKRLIALKRLDRQSVGGGTRDSADGAQSIPLGERRTDSGKPGVERSVMPVLDLLDGSSENLQIRGHQSSIPAK